jgi:tripartite-type tricarboxylate transporter receptor subunit TctC
VVENRSGAGGILGTEAAAKATPDGYTIFVYGINQAITAALYQKLPYNHLRDFTPLSLYATMPNILYVNLAVPAKTVAEFVNLAKANPGKLKYVSSGIGASPHLTMELFKSVTGTDIVHVPYKNMAQGITDILGGQLQATFGNLPAAIPNVKAGRVRALAVTSAKRAEQLPEVPTIIESGIPDFEVTVWQGFALPRGTPAPIGARVHAVMMQALNDPVLRQRFFEQGVMAAPLTPEEFTAFIRGETARWDKVVRETGTKVE